MILTASIKSILFTGKNGPCYANDLVCQFQKYTIVWHKDIIHSCLFELIHSVNFTVTEDILYSETNSLLFQLENNFTACNITMFRTTSGIVLSNDTNSFSLNKTSRTINVIDGLILADINFKMFYVHQENLKTKQILNTRVCKTFNSLLYIISDTKDGFIQLYDMNGDQLLLQKQRNILYIADCIAIPAVSITDIDRK